MDNGAAMSQCTDAIYSEEYLDFLVKYDNAIITVNQQINPDCITIINDTFLVAYKKMANGNTYSIQRYGYDNIPKCFGLCDVSAVHDTGADVVTNLPGLTLTGKDTLIGFVDTGIDYLNPLFRNNLKSRIAYIWDQTKEVYGTGPSVFGYGAEYSREDIERALANDNPYSIVPTRDENGHGTFIASVAAGGVDETEPFRGMAPECEIVMVKLKPAKNNLKDYFFIQGDEPCYSENDIILGVRYLLNKAFELGKPMAICLGIGTSQGDHNGNTKLEQYLDSLVNLRGICSVAPVGNQLGYGGHYEGSENYYELQTENKVEINVGSNCNGFSLEVWGNAPGLLQTRVISPTGESFDRIPTARDGEASHRYIYEGTILYADNVIVDDDSGDQMILLRFDKPSEGIWTIGLTELMLQSGRSFDCWLPIKDFLDTDVAFVRPEPDITITAPGNTRGAITVAGYNHINNAIYIRSGRGYTRKGLIKPDITAPAVNVQGAFATGTGRALYTRRSGSSISAAITAGAAALMLQWGLVQGNITVINTEVIRQLFIRGARQENNEVYPNKIWGYGILDLLNTFERLRL
ncbi:MAG: S8 family peptidase [Wujia sp.]